METIDITVNRTPFLLTFLPGTVLSILMFGLIVLITEGVSHYGRMNPARKLSVPFAVVFILIFTGLSLIVSILVFNAVYPVLMTLMPRIFGSSMMMNILNYLTVLILIFSFILLYALWLKLNRSEVIVMAAAGLASFILNQILFFLYGTYLYPFLLRLNS